MPSSRSRLEGDLTTELESPEMTLQAGASTNCDGTCGHCWTLGAGSDGVLVPLWGEQSLPGEVPEPLQSLCPARGLLRLAPVHARHNVFWVQHCVFVCIFESCKNVFVLRGGWSSELIIGNLLTQKTDTNT